MPHQLSRRTLLRLIATATSGTLLAACTPARRPPSTVDNEQLTALTRGLPNPRPGGAAIAAVPDAALATFLAFSALLTGVEQLDPTVGRIYLAALQTNSTVDLDGLYAQAGFTPSTTPTLADLENAGFFAQEAARVPADQILEMWYTGKYNDRAGNPVVVTYTGALAWQVLSFTKATTLCGAPNFWAEPAAEAVW